MSIQKRVGGYYRTRRRWLHTSFPAVGGLAEFGRIYAGRSAIMTLDSNTTLRVKSSAGTVRVLYVLFPRETT